MRVQVIGPHPVAGVASPGMVELDETRVHVRALQRAGHVRIPQPEQPVEPDTADETEEDS